MAKLDLSHANKVKINKKKRSHLSKNLTEDYNCPKKKLKKVNKQTEDYVISDISKTESKKRKITEFENASTSTQQKRSKKSTDSSDELEEPTEYELNECNKPENQNSVETVRGKKRKQHLRKLENEKTGSVDRERNQITSYLNKWKNNKSEWKFEKLRQVYIQNHIFDEDKISNDLWPLVIEYLEGCKGASRDSIVRSSEDIITKMDEENKSSLQDCKYKRARELLQLLSG